MHAILYVLQSDAWNILYGVRRVFLAQVFSRGERRRGGT
jgi:hypothetical protein